MLGVQQRWLQPMPLDTPIMIQGVEVTAVDANHCPGAVQFLFRLADGRKFVHTGETPAAMMNASLDLACLLLLPGFLLCRSTHTCPSACCSLLVAAAGDMRFSPRLLDNEHIQRFRGCDAVYLDTTYCNPRHCFPPQEESIEYVASTIQLLLQKDAEEEGEWQGGVCAGAGEDEGKDAGEGEGEVEGEGAAAAAAQQQPSGEAGVGKYRRLYLISTYGIGKERILTGVCAWLAVSGIAW